MIDADTVECRCCQHQRKLEGWPAEWCEPVCILRRFPAYMWGLWELFGRVIRPLSAGMAVVWEIDEDRLEKWGLRAGFTQNELEDGFLHDVLREMLDTWENTKAEIAVDQRAIEEIIRMDEVYDLEED